MLEPQDLNLISEAVLKKTEPLFNKLYTKLQEHICMFEQINMRLDGLETRMDKLEIRLDGLEAGKNNLETHISNLETEVLGIREYHRKMDKIFDMVKMLYADLSFKIISMDDRAYEAGTKYEA